MCIGDALRELAAFLDECEDEGRVTGVGLVEGHGRGASSEVSAEVEVTLSVAAADGDGDLSLDGSSVDEAGRLGLSFESPESVVPTPNGRVDVEPTGVTFGSDATLTVTLTATVPTDDGVGIDGEGATGNEPTTDGGPAAEDRGRPGEPDEGSDEPEPPAEPDRDRGVPPFRDPELLAEVYESCDTFAEMTDAIGMDVTAETVRRYMIDYGIHQPNTYDTGGDEGEEDRDVEDGGAHAAETAEDGSPVVLADGIGLPEDVTVETLIETVERSNTLYEVERDVGVDREDALEMLRELDLLDLVVGRLSTQDRRDITREDVVQRLREASATGGG
ncbi:hypothetical protein ACFQE8_17050 [Salinirubellus sp. GCM10025818]|jgi:hypothetical protein|uniref:hypothetical protein n=1 Tax=Salinirubellus TaxID=2162630 RepID=UPI0030D6108D